MQCGIPHFPLPPTLLSPVEASRDFVHFTSRQSINCNSKPLMANFISTTQRSTQHASHRCHFNLKIQFFNFSFLHASFNCSIDRNEIEMKIKMALCGEREREREKLFYDSACTTLFCFKIHLHTLLCRFVMSLKCFSCTTFCFPSSSRYIFFFCPRLLDV